MPNDFMSRKAAMDKVNDIAVEFLKDHTIQCDIAAGVAVDIKNDVIKTLPAADAVEVVRCKDCRFWDNGRCEGIENGLIRDYTSPDDFCSYGERKNSLPEDIKQTVSESFAENSDS